MSKNIYCLPSCSWPWLDVVFSWLFPSSVLFCFLSSSECILNLFRVVLCKIILDWEIYNYYVKDNNLNDCLFDRKNIHIKNNKVINVTLCKWIIAKGKYKVVETNPNILCLLVYILCFYLFDSHRPSYLEFSNFSYLWIL